MQNQGQNTFTQEQFLALVELNQKLTFRIQQLEQQLAQFQKLVFGKKHERVELLNPGQLNLGLDLGETTPVTVSTEDISYTRTKTKKKVQPNRSPLPADLPREVIVIEPEQDTAGMKLIGHEITEQLEMTPAKFYVKQYKRAKYAKPEGNGVIIGALPEFSLPKSIAGSSVLAHLLVGKYVDHLPLHRQIKMFSRSGMTFSDSTINDWIKGSIDLVAILHQKNEIILKESGYIQMDETPIKVLDSEKKGQTHRGYFWVSHSPTQKVVTFNYNKGRSAEFPTAFLQDYKGYIQTDGYGVYDAFDQREDITMVCCMAHARRNFFDAQGNDKQRAEYFIGAIQPLYRLEQELKDNGATPEVILQKRKEIADPILKDLHIWLKANLPQVLPKSTIGQAIGYALARWEKIMRYTKDAALLIDNNLIENQIRPVAVGRKNYLFCGSHESAQRAAIIYSLLGTCKLNNVNPFEWLDDVLKKLPARKANKIADLLPQNWKPNSQDVV